MFKKSFQNSFSLGHDEEAQLFQADVLRNRIVRRAKQKAHLLHSRGTVHVPGPYVQEEEGNYKFAALQSFDRRAFLASLAEERKRRSTVSGAKETIIPEVEMDPGDASSIVAMFAKVDVNGDGGVTREELVKNCHLLNLSTEEAHRLFDKLDVNGDGEVSSEEFAEAVVQIENNAVGNLVGAICDGDVSRLTDGLQRHTSTSTYVDTKRLQVRVAVDPRSGEGRLGPMPLLNFPNQTGDLGRRLGGDEDRRIPRCSHVATEELEIAYLGLPGHGIGGGLFLIAGDTLLHAVLRNAHLPNRVAVAAALLECGADPNAQSSDGKRPFELDLQGRRHVWRRDHADHVATKAGAHAGLCALAGLSGI